MKSVGQVYAERILFSRGCIDMNTIGPIMLMAFPGPGISSKRLFEILTLCISGVSFGKFTSESALHVCLTDPVAGGQCTIDFWSEL